MAKKDNRATKKLSTEPYKGVRDFYPEDSATLRYIFSKWREVVERCGYVEYKASILEPSELYKAKGVENEEMVKDQTYTFTDRGDREVTLRPEMTPTVARMVAARRRDLGFPLRLYSIPNCFRYERSQRGRLREFWQLNVDLFGTHSPAADAEIIGIAYGAMKVFGAKDEDFVIKVGSRSALEKSFAEANVSEENKKALFTLLDRRNKMSEAEFEEGLSKLGVPSDILSANAVPQDIAEMIENFAAVGVKNIVYAPEVVRGFAYYTGMVFEVFDTHAENNRSLMGGGRFDNLTELFDDEPLPGVGFAIGDVTMRDFLEVHGLLPTYVPPTQVYIAITDPSLATKAQMLGGELRQNGVSVAIDFGDKKLGDQIKTANKHKIPYLVVVGEDELTSGEFTVRDLASGTEEKYPRATLASFFKK